MPRNNLDHVKVIVPVLDLAHLPGALKSIQEICALGIDDLQVEIVIDKNLNSPAIVEQKLAEISATLTALQKELCKMSQQLDDLTAEVAASITVEESAIALINGFSARLDAAIAAAGNGDTAALPALSASIKSERENLATAVTSNTPAQPSA